MTEYTTLDVDISRLNEALDEVASGLGVTNTAQMSHFLRRQVSLLALALIKYTYPQDSSKTKRAIEKKVRGKIGFLQSDRKGYYKGEGKKHWHGEVYWYAWTPSGLFGLGKNEDMREASDQDVYRLFFRADRRGHIRVGKRGRQSVYLRHKYAFTEGQISKLVRRIQRHVGRLKAGWLPSWRAVGSMGQQPPAGVLQHEKGARGYTINNLGVPGHPTFTLVNNAVAAGSKHMNRTVNFCLELRRQMLLKDFQLYVRGVKEKARLM